jgi:hypothetical protein
MVSPLLLGVRRQQEDTYQIPARLWSEQGSRTEHPGQRTGADAVLLALGLDVPGSTRAEILDERPGIEPAPPPPPEERKTGLRSWWERFER